MRPVAGVDVGDGPRLGQVEAGVVDASRLADGAVDPVRAEDVVALVFVALARHRVRALVRLPDVGELGVVDHAAAVAGQCIPETLFGPVLRKREYEVPVRVSACEGNVEGVARATKDVHSRDLHALGQEPIGDSGGTEDTQAAGQDADRAGERRGLLFAIDHHGDDAPAREFNCRGQSRGSRSDDHDSHRGLLCHGKSVRAPVGPINLSGLPAVEVEHSAEAFGPSEHRYYRVLHTCSIAFARTP